MTADTRHGRERHLQNDEDRNNRAAICARVAWRTAKMRVDAISRLSDLRVKNHPDDWTTTGQWIPRDFFARWQEWNFRRGA